MERKIYCLLALTLGFSRGVYSSNFDCLHCSSLESKDHLLGQPLSEFFKSGEFGYDLPPAHKDCMDKPDNLDIKRVPCSTRCLQIYFNGTMDNNPEGGFKRVFFRVCADKFIWGGVPCLNAPCCGVMDKAKFKGNIELTGRGCTCGSEDVCNSLTPQQMDTAPVCPNACSVEGNCPAGQKCTSCPDSLGFQCDGENPVETKDCPLHPNPTTTTKPITTTTNGGDDKTTTPSAAGKFTWSWILLLITFAVTREMIL